jgi:anaerobic selenocysteine-containing dehydrogenase
LQLLRALTRWDPEDGRIAEALVENSSNLEGATGETLKEKGWVRFTGLGTSPVVYMSVPDARARRIRDGEIVRVST